MVDLVRNEVTRAPALQRFALVRDPDDAESVVGYGLVLPDGSAISISWPPDSGSSCYRTASAEGVAFLCAADLVFLDDRVRSVPIHKGSVMSEVVKPLSIELVGIQEIQDLLFRSLRDRFPKSFSVFRRCVADARGP